MTLDEYCAKQDHSLLGHICTRAQVEKYCDEVLAYGFASICVNPDNVTCAASLLQGRAGVSSVIGFPQGFEPTPIKVAEALGAIGDGATDLDCVINHSRLHEGDDKYVRNELNTIVQAARDKKPDIVVKFIMYMPYAPVQTMNAGETRRIAEMIIESGADYIKFNKDFALIRSIVGSRIKMKHSGCPTFEDTVNAIELGCERIGHEIAPRFIEDNRAFFTG